MVGWPVRVCGTSLALAVHGVGADTQGRAVVTETAARLRFAPFGRMWVAQRRLWRSLVAAVRDERVALVIRRELDAYLERIGSWRTGDGLPIASIELHRLVVVPRVMINGAAYQSIATGLGDLPAISSLEGGAELRDFLFLGLIQEIEAAIARRQPSPERPLPAGRAWNYRLERWVRLAHPLRGTGMARASLCVRGDTPTDHACDAQNRRRADQKLGGLLAVAFAHRSQRNSPSCCFGRLMLIEG